MPLRGDEKAMTVNWRMIEISADGGKVTYRSSSVTDSAVNRESIADLAANGKARWKVENEVFGVLKTKDYNLEHYFGHGEQHLATVVSILTLLAFARHTVCESSNRAWRAATRELVTRRGFLRNLHSITTYLAFPSWDALPGTLACTRSPRLGP
jgi:hypothetical protein